jgi:uncharacterized protein (TIGR02246 family)
MIMSENDQREVRNLYQNLIESWNRQDGAGMALVFAADGNMVGFDGSQVNGATEIESSMSQIFSHHPTAKFVTIIREVRMLGRDSAILRAVVGMVPRDHDDINPNVNAIQTVMASKKDGAWRIEMFQNTPAAFHGRPEESQKLTSELRNALKVSSH